MRDVVAVQRLVSIKQALLHVARGQKSDEVGQHGTCSSNRPSPKAPAFNGRIHIFSPVIFDIGFRPPCAGSRVVLCVDAVVLGRSIHPRRQGQRRPKDEPR
jgi:hypothetical protein